MAFQVLTGHFDLFYVPADETRVTASSDYVGMTDPSGLRLDETVNIRDITGDAYGEATFIDGIYQGKNCILSFVLEEMSNAMARRLVNPFTATAADATGFPGRMGTPGTMLSSYAGVLEAIPRTGTPANSAYADNANGMRFLGVVISPHSRNFSTSEDFLPVQFRAFPFVDSSDSKVKLYKRIAAIGAALTHTRISS